MVQVELMVQAAPMVAQELRVIQVRAEQVDKMELQV
jgi:hypothetical protein